MAEAVAAQPVARSEVSEHVEAIVSGRLKQALALTLVILAAELAGGIWSHSLALLSDAGHVTTDVFALALAWFAVKQTERPADDARTFGYHRAGILAAMTNGATLIVLVFVIAWEAAQRFAHPEPVQGGVVIVSALVGVGVNTWVALSFRAQGSNLNIRAAILHAVGDLLASIGVIIAGVVILLTGWLFIDPLISVLIAALIGWNAIKIVGETVNILLEGTPRGMDVGALRGELASVAGIRSHHDLHVWSISPEHLALSVHIVVEDQTLADAEEVMRRVETTVSERFGIGHTTVQVEFCQPCAGDYDHVTAQQPHRTRLARLATTARRRTPASRRRAAAAPAKAG